MTELFEVPTDERGRMLTIEEQTSIQTELPQPWQIVHPACTAVS